MPALFFDCWIDMRHWGLGIYFYFLGGVRLYAYIGPIIFAIDIAAPSEQGE